MMNGHAAEYGASFCVSGAPCSTIQHAMLVRCLSNCGSCNLDATATVLGDCMADMDQSASGNRAVEVLQLSCATGAECSDLQQGVAARCLGNCRACDRDATNTVLGACTLDGHGSAASTIEETCSGVLPPPPPPPPPVGGIAPPPAPPPPPPPPPECSMLQTAVAERCREDCGMCDTGTVSTILGDCVTNDGVARDDLCAHVERPPRTQCTGLQMAIITRCSQDCAGCDFDSVNVILAGCSVSDVPQLAGTQAGTVCRAGPPCSGWQHDALVECISNCDGCDTDSSSRTSILLDMNDCVVDEDRVQGGVRAAEVIATSCSTGIQCTELQQAVTAHCIRDCESCDRTTTGTVLGACTSDGRSAMSMISMN
eukprot:COSAG02_NODE_9723_length_2132_cov_1.557304_2_plen_369_part_00